MLNIFQTLEEKLILTFEKAFPREAEIEKQNARSLNPKLTPSGKPEFGDFQVNGALSLAKVLKKSPRQIASIICDHLEADETFLTICLPPEIAGPGFINLRIRPDCLIQQITLRLSDKRLGVPSVQKEQPTENHRVIVDFSSPNIAKEMHVGHLRSTIIGDSIARILEFRGYQVLRLNHVGDWGTQFGMLITHLKEMAPEALETADAISLGDLVSFYKQAKKRFDEEEEFQALSRQEVVNLQSGKPLSIKAWKLLCHQSRIEFEKIYNRLNIHLTERGESFYNPYLKDVIDDLNDKHLLVTDQGAKCIFLKDLIGKDGNPQPVIIQKSDGGYNYSTTDLAAIKYRVSDPPKGDGANRLIYVTDSGQASHFENIFKIAKNAKWLPKDCRVEHVPFGLVQGEDGKKLKTRSGETVKLIDLLNEAILRAKQDLIQRLHQQEREENPEFIEAVSNVVGIAAVKYADLSQNRVTNYQFSFDKMLSLQGNTAPYLLYALVRIAGITRKGGKLDPQIKEFSYNETQEWELIRELLKLDLIITEVEAELLPNRLCTYLFELSQVFNRFYDSLPILKAKEPFYTSRLALCNLTAETLKLGMSLLGIPTLERM